MSKVAIGASEIAVGVALPWPIYDRQDRLLMDAGAVIGSPRQLDALLRRGIFRRRGNEFVPPKASEVADRSSPFEKFDSLLRRLQGIYQSVLATHPEAGDRLRNLAGDMRALYASAPDAMLGAVHLSHEYDYTLCHPLHCAILCEMMGRLLGYTEARLDSLAAAALSQNIAMLRLQETLQKQAQPLTDGQREAIRRHPLRGAEMLAEAGVQDELWLTIVRQHHERYDGAGYPSGIGGEELLEEAQLLGLSDRYGAMISGRSYRDGQQAKAALRDLFLAQGKEFSQELTQRFIREIGVYPPGSFVELENGEVAIVIKRGRAPLKPVVSSYVAAGGRLYTRPFRRDTAAAGQAVRGTCQPDTGVPIDLGIIFAV